MFDGAVCIAPRANDPGYPAGLRKTWYAWNVSGSSATRCQYSTRPRMGQEASNARWFVTPVKRDGLDEEDRRHEAYADPRCNAAICGL